MKELNKLVKEIMGKPMTKEQLSFQDELRARVKRGEITGLEGQKIWQKKYFPEEVKRNEK
jgi:hypothetical protein